MIFNFNKIDSDELYDSDVILVSGKYNIFNNIVVDKVKEKHRVIEDDNTMVSSLMQEFTGDESEVYTSKTSLGTDTLEEFIELNKIPSVLGKRVCTVDFSMMNKKQVEWFEKYIKKPSKLGVLVVTFTDFKTALKYQKSRFVRNSSNVNMINLSFPNKSALKRIIKDNLSKFKIEDRALDLFIWRLSDNYEMYSEAFDKVYVYEGDIITYEIMKNLLVGIDNYNIDDFIRMLLNPPRNKFGKPRNVYKALNCLMDDLGPRKLVSKVRSAINRVYEMRIYMNKGIISAGKGFVLSEKALNEFKDKLPESSTLKKMSNFTLSKYYKLARQTSLRDLMVMKMILSNNRINNYSTEQYERVLFSLINRCTYCADRVMNDAGMKNTLEEQLYQINKVRLSDKE